MSFSDRINVSINFTGDDRMDSEVWSWIIFYSFISLINLIAVVMKIKINLNPNNICIWRFTLPFASIAFFIILVKVFFISLNFDFPTQNDLRFEHAKIYQIVGSMTLLLGAILLILNLFTLTFFHGCYYSWQVWKSKISDERIEIKFSNLKVTLYSIGTSCLMIFLTLPYYLLDIFQTVLGISFLFVFIERTRSLLNLKNKKEIG